MGGAPSSEDRTDYPQAGVAEPHGQGPRMAGPSPGGLEEDLPARPRVIAPSLLLPAEIVIFELKPSLWYVLFISLPMAGAGLALAILSLAAAELPSPVRHWGVLIGAWVMGLRVAVAFLQWLGLTYVLTDRRILKQHGVLNVRVECAGLEEIQNTFVAQAAIQRLLGIGNLFFRCGDRRRDVHVWEHVRRPKEVHALVIREIDRWKHSLSSRAGPGA